MDGGHVPFMSRKRIVKCVKGFPLGFLSVTFWWTIWTGADQLHLGDTSIYGLLYYAVSYGFLIIAYVCYYIVKRIFKNRFKVKVSKELPEDLEKQNVTAGQKNHQFLRHFSRKKLIIAALAISIYFLGFQYVLLWRNIFGTFYYFVDELGYKGVPHWVTLLSYVIIAGGTMIFTSGTGIVLLPTLESFRHDNIHEIRDVFQVYNSYEQNADEIQTQNSIDLFYDHCKSSLGSNKKVKSVVIENKNTNSILEPVTIMDTVSKEESHNNSAENIQFKTSLEQTIFRFLKINYAHIILNALGGIYWCAIWRYYDYLLEEMKLQSDLMGLTKLLPMSIGLHIINHMVLLPWKNRYRNKYIVLAFNFILGAFTTIIWASLWYVLDRISAQLDSHLWIVKITLHVGAFVVLFITGHCSVIV